MDEHKEKEEEIKFQESPEQLQAPRKQEAEDSSEESIGQQHHHQSGGDKEGGNAAEDEDEEQTVVVQLKEVVVETGSAPWVLGGVFASPCSLLQYLLRACARLCCGLHGAFDDGPKPQQPPAAANSAQQGDGDKANVKLNLCSSRYFFGYRIRSVD
jgi:hypothetical protein